MLAPGITYEHVVAVAHALHIAADADGVDDVALVGAVIDSGCKENKIAAFAGSIRTSMIETGEATPATLAILDELLTLCDAETALCFVVLKARGR